MMLFRHHFVIHTIPICIVWPAQGISSSYEVYESNTHYDMTPKIVVYIVIIVSLYSVSM